MFFTGAIYLWTDYFRNIETYRHQTGVVALMKIDTVVKFRNATYPLRIQVDNTTESYFLSDEYKNQFDEILNNVMPGDKISITFENGLFNLGSQNNIIEITKNGTTVFDEKIFKSNILQTAIFLSVMTILLGILTNKRKQIGMLLTRVFWR